MIELYIAACINEVEIKLEMNPYASVSILLLDAIRLKNAYIYT